MHYHLHGVAVMINHNLARYATLCGQETKVINIPGIYM